MHERHSVFKEPENQNAKIWRYMDFTKFVYMLEKESLFFTRSDKFEDPYEGSLNQITVDWFRSFWFETVEGDIETKERGFRSYLDHVENSKKWTTISCWHMNEFESDAMWKLYLKSNEGIAIQSSYSRLCRAFDKAKEQIHIGMVKYEDFNTYTIPVGNDFNRYLIKRKSFEHEKEIRAVNTKLPTNEGKLDYSLLPVEFGENIPVDISTLIEKVYIAPNSPGWIKDLVESILRKYGLESIEVIQSSLGRNLK